MTYTYGQISLKFMNLNLLKLWMLQKKYYNIVKRLIFLMNYITLVVYNNFDKSI